MNTYRITYRGGSRGAPMTIKADSLNGFTQNVDSYIFKIGDDVVAAIPKSQIVSIQLIAVPTGEEGI